MGPGIVEEGGDFDPPESPPSRDYFPDYIVVVIVPLIIAIVLCLLLAYIMFGRREGVYVLQLLPDNLTFKVQIDTNKLDTPFFYFQSQKKYKDKPVSVSYFLVSGYCFF